MRKVLSKPIFWYKILTFFLFWTTCFACNLSKPIEIKLPSYSPQLSVECYLEEGKPYRLLLTESNEFTGPTVPNILQFAVVTIAYKGEIDTLRYIPTIDTSLQKVYNYQSSKLTVYDTVNEYQLEIKDLLSNRVITGNTKFLPKVPIDNIKIKLSDSTAAVECTFNDPKPQRNYYRFLIHSDTLEAKSRFGVILSDELFTSEKIVLFTNYRFDYGDPLYLGLYHIDEKYFNFLRSVQAAIGANGSPFVQPSKIKSTVNGGLGVFTALSRERKFLIAK